METTTGTFIADGVYHHNCAHCNAWADKEWMQEQYRKGIVDKYGDNVLKELKQRAKIARTNSRGELEEVISDSRLELAWMLDNPDIYQV